MAMIKHHWFHSQKIIHVHFLNINYFINLQDKWKQKAVIWGEVWSEEEGMWIRERYHVRDIPFSFQVLWFFRSDNWHLYNCFSSTWHFSSWHFPEKVGDTKHTGLRVDCTLFSDRFLPFPSSPTRQKNGLQVGGQWERNLCKQRSQLKRNKSGPVNKWIRWCDNN